MNPTTLERIERQSVQVLPDAKQNNGATVGGFWSDPVQRTDLLPAWGTRERERWLRWYDRHNYNTLWQSATAGLVKKFASTPSELKGGRNLTMHYDDVLRFAQFLKGQRTLKKLVARDYLRFDGGAYVEIIAPGNPMRAPTGRVTALAHLDSYMCLPTGDPAYPVLYTDRGGKQHLMHHTRVLHFVDMPDGDQNNPGYGLCALSRAIAIVERQILMGRYVVTNLDDKPPPGMLLIGGLTKQQWEARWNQFRQEQSTDARPEWGRVITFHGADASVTPSIVPVSFSNPPQNFDFKVYVELDVHEFALAIGVDIQDLWELTGGNLGSAGQSEVQHAKSRGNTLGDLLSEWELGMNNYVLPASLEYEHKVRDPYEANERATNAQIWASFTSSAGASLTAEEKRQILANQVEAVADAITDKDGKLIRLPDSDPQDASQWPDDVTIEDAAPNTDQPAGEQVTAQDSTPNANAPLRKDFAETRTAFVTDFSDLAHAGLADDVSRRRAGVVMRAQIARLGRAAYADGLKAGGVEDGLSDEDLNNVAVLIAQQSAYVTDFLNGLYADGLTDTAITAHAGMWSNKSLQPFYDAGLLSADANGVYEWQLGQAEHCASCLAMSGQKHRLKDYADRGVLPKSDKLACKGYLCACTLVRTSGRTKGNWF